MHAQGLLPQQVRHDSDRFLLESAAILHNVGLSISHSGYHKHSYYIIKNSELLLGLTALEVETIALIARYHRKKTPHKKDDEFDTAATAALRKKVECLCSILRIAVALERGGMQDVAGVKLVSERSRVVMFVQAAAEESVSGSDRRFKDVSLEMFAATLEDAYFHTTFGKNLQIVELVDAPSPVPVASS